MKKVIGFFALVVMFSACMENSYDYVEIVAEQSIFGGVDTKEREKEAIKAASDTSAYLKAFERCYIWEWFDQGLTVSDRELVYALSNAKSAKMKLIRRQYHKIKTISKEQIYGIKQTLELYNALGGQY